jgi:cytochrome b561
MDLTVATYLLYLVIAIPLTIWVASTLSRNGRVFLVDVFNGNSQLAAAVNRLLVVGFYLVNLGFVTLYLGIDEQVGSVREVIELLSVKIGLVLLILGLLHFVNVYVFNAIRRRSRLESMRTPPVPPQGFTPPAYAPYPPAPPQR